MSEAQPWAERVQIGPATLYLGDSLALLAAGLIPPTAAIVADPPYGVNYRYGGGGREHPILKGHTHLAPIVGDDRPFDPAPWLAHGAAATRRRRGNVLAPGVMRVALFGPDHYCSAIPPASGAWYTWDKSCGGGPADSFTDSELIWMGTRSARRVYRHKWKGRTRCGVGEDSNARLNQSQKPVALMAWVIETLRVPVGDLVCDPYAGSMSTVIACLRTGRPCLAIEIDPPVFAIGAARVARWWERYGDPHA